MIQSYLKFLSYFILNFSCTVCKTITETLLAQSSLCIMSLNVIREAKFWVSVTNGVQREKHNLQQPMGYRCLPSSSSLFFEP